MLTLCVPGVAERRVGLQEPAVRVGRRSSRARRLRHPGRARAGEQGPPARHSHLRYLGHGQPEVRHQRADVPRLAHAHGRDRSARQGERLHLCLRFVRRPLGRRTAGLLRRRDRRSEERALPPRSDSRPARGAADGGDRELAAHLRRPRAAAAARRAGARRRAQAAAAGAGVPRVPRVPQVPVAAAGAAGAAGCRGCGGRGGRRGAAAADEANTRTESVSRHHRLSGHRARRRRVRRLRAPAQHPRSRAADAHRRGRRHQHVVLALGDVQQRRHQGAVHRRMGRWHRSRAAATPTSPSGAPTRSSRIEKGKMQFKSYYKMPAPQTVARELRGAQRIAHSDPRARRDGAGLVSGRHLRLRLDRRRRSRRRSPSSIAVRSTRRGSSWAARGRSTGTTD